MASGMKSQLMFVQESYYGQSIGGSELQSYYLLLEARDRGIDTRYCFLSDGSEYERLENITYYEIRRNRLATKLKNTKLPYIRCVRALLQTQRPKYVYQRGGSVFTGVVAHYGLTSSAKTVFHIADDMDVDKSLRSSNLLRRADRVVADYGINNIKYIIAQTQHQAEMLEAHFGRRPDAVIPNGHEIPPEADKDDSVIRVLWIANWKRMKQPEIFLEMVQSTKWPRNVRFCMLGRNRAYKALVDRAKALNIEVTGEVSNEEVNARLNEGHILVNTSKREGFSNVFIQAWGRRVPVVSLHVDPDGVIEREALGFCSGSVHQLAKDVDLLVADTTKRNQMGERAREYATKNYSMQNVHDLLGLVVS